MQSYPTNRSNLFPDQKVQLANPHSDMETRNKAANNSYWKCFLQKFLTLAFSRNRIETIQTKVKTKYFLCALLTDSHRAVCIVQPIGTVRKLPLALGPPCTQ